MLAFKLATPVLLFDRLVCLVQPAVFFFICQDNFCDAFSFGHLLYDYLAKGQIYQDRKNV